MKINYNVKGEKRKALAEAVSQELNAPMKYLGAPTFAYEVGGYRIDKSGMLEGEDDFDLVADLCGRHNFSASSEDGMQESGGSETEGICGLAIEMPRDGFTEATIENLKRMVESKATLIKKALGTSELHLEVSDETIRFPWFKGVADAETVKAYTHFVTALCETAKTQNRVSAVEKAVENEKYAFRCFLLRLGFIGPKYKDDRKLLLSNLSGSSAFRNPKEGSDSDE